MSTKPQSNIFVTVIVRVSIYLLIPIGAGWKIYDLTQKVETQSQEISQNDFSEQEFQRQKARLERENENIQSDLNAMEKERDQLIRELQGKAQDISLDKQQIASLETEILEKDSKLKALTGQLSDGRNSSWIVQQEIKDDLATTKAENEALEGRLAMLREEAETRKTEFGETINQRRGSLGVLASHFEQVETMSVQEVQMLFAKQQSEFRTDLKMLMEAFESEMNTLIDRRGKRVKEQEIRESLERVRNIYERLRDKYQLPVFDVKIQSIQQQIQYT